MLCETQESNRVLCTEAHTREGRALSAEGGLCAHTTDRKSVECGGRVVCTHKVHT